MQILSRHFGDVLSHTHGLMVKVLLRYICACGLPPLHAQFTSLGTKLLTLAEKPGF